MGVKRRVYSLRKGLRVVLVEKRDGVVLKAFGSPIATFNYFSEEEKNNSTSGLSKHKSGKHLLPTRRNMDAIFIGLTGCSHGYFARVFEGLTAHALVAY